MQLRESFPTTVVEFEHHKGFVLWIFEVPVVKFGAFRVYNKTVRSQSMNEAALA